jgi:glycosyltransferase involved in cell wall biosynthesis
VKAFFWAGGDDGCAWYRMHLPSIALAARGNTTHADQILDPRRWGDADVVVGQRVCQPGPTMQWQAWAREGRRLVFDVDDHLFAFDDTNGEAREFYTQPQVRARLADNMAAATLVTCATERLAREMARYNPNTVVVPNGLPAALLDWPARDVSGKVTIGWAGSPSTAAELPLVASTLQRLLDKPPAGVRLSLHTVGVDADTVVRAGLRHILTRGTPWIPHSMTYLRHIDFDIWVAPYRPTEFNEAKVPTKALEAAFLGIPIVASDTEGYRRFIRHGETGFLARRPGDWAGHIRTLAADPDLRARMGKAAREQARDHTIDRTGLAWERVILGDRSTR